MSKYKFISEEAYRIAKQKGIGRTNVWNRVNKLGWDIEKAITLPVYKSDLISTEMYKIAKNNGISRQAIYERVKNGMDPLVAAKTPPMKIPFEISGMQEYAMYKGDELLSIGTLREISQELNIKMNTLRFYLSPTYKKRVGDRKNGKFEKQRMLVRLEDD